MSHTELVRLRPRSGSANLFDVDVLYKPRDQEEDGPRDRPGPARFSTRSYRRNWERIFGGSPGGGGKKPLLN